MNDLYGLGMVIREEPEFKVVFLNGIQRAAILWPNQYQGRFSLGTVFECHYRQIEFDEKTCRVPFEICGPPPKIREDGPNEVKILDNRCLAIFSFDLSSPVKEFKWWSKLSSMYVLKSEQIGYIFMEPMVLDKSGKRHSHDIIAQYEDSPKGENMTGYCEFKRMVVPLACLHEKVDTRSQEEEDAWVWVVKEVISTASELKRDAQATKMKNLGPELGRMEYEDDMARQKKLANAEDKDRQRDQYPQKDPRDHKYPSQAPPGIQRDQFSNQGSQYGSQGHQYPQQDPREHQYPNQAPPGVQRDQRGPRDQYPNQAPPGSQRGPKDQWDQYSSQGSQQGPQYSQKDPRDRQYLSQGSSSKYNQGSSFQYQRDQGPQYPQQDPRDHREQMDQRGAQWDHSQYTSQDPRDHYHSQRPQGPSRPNQGSSYGPQRGCDSRMDDFSDRGSQRGGPSGHQGPRGPQGPQGPQSFRGAPSEAGGSYFTAPSEASSQRSKVEELSRQLALAKAQVDNADWREIANFVAKIEQSWGVFLDSSRLRGHMKSTNFEAFMDAENDLNKAQKICNGRR